MKTNSKTFLRLHARLEQPGKGSQEWRYDNPKRIVVGYMMGCDLWLPIPGIEPQMELIERKGNKISIRIPGNLEGRIVQSKQETTLAHWRQLKSTVEKKGVCLLPLEPKTNLVLKFGTYQLVLWISHPPQSEKSPTLLPKLKNLLSSIPKIYVLMLVVSFFLHYETLEILKVLPPLHTVMAPPIDHDFRKISVKQLGDIDKKLQEQLERAASLGIKITGNKISRPPNPVDASGFIQAVTTTAPANKSASFSSLFTANGFSKDLNKALSNKSFGDVLNSQMKSLGNGNLFNAPSTGTTNQGGGTLYGIGGNANPFKGPGVVTDLGIKAELPKTTATQAQPQANTGTLDEASIRRVINSRRGELDACYESALLGNPGLKGKATVYFQIQESGLVSGARVESESLQSKSFQACLTQKVSGWVFNKPKGGSVPVKLPLIFSPSGKN